MTITAMPAISGQTVAASGGSERCGTILERRCTIRPTPYNVAATTIVLIANLEIVVSRFAITISCREILLSRRASTLYSILAESAVAGVP